MGEAIARLKQLRNCFERAKKRLESLPECGLSEAGQPYIQEVADALQSFAGWFCNLTFDDMGLSGSARRIHVAAAAFDAIVAAQADTGRPAFPVASMPENFDEAYAAQLLSQGVCVLMGLETALAAIKAAQIPAGASGWRPMAALPPRDTTLLSEAEGKALLSAAGIAVPKSVSSPTLAGATAAAQGLTAPFALKGLGFAHKTEAGAVRLGLTSLEGQAEMQGATGYLVEEMVTGAIEVAPRPIWPLWRILPCNWGL